MAINVYPRHQSHHEKYKHTNDLKLADFNGLHLPFVKLLVPGIFPKVNTLRR